MSSKKFRKANKITRALVTRTFFIIIRNYNNRNAKMSELHKVSGHALGGRVRGFDTHYNKLCKKMETPLVHVEIVPDK